MEGSTLTVHVIDGQEILDCSNPIIKITVGNQNFTTKNVERAIRNPVWDELFHFDIFTGKENIIIQLFNGNREMEGRKKEINLISLSQHDQFDLMSISLNRSRARKLDQSNELID